MKPKTAKLAPLFLLLTAWLLIAAWQVIEHRRVREAERRALLVRARDISRSLEVVIRSESHSQAIARPRLQAALRALARTRDLQAVALVNPGGEIIASAGPRLSDDIGALPPGSTVWGRETLTVVQLVQFGDRPRADPSAGGGVLLVEPGASRDGGAPPPLPGLPSPREAPRSYRSPGPGPDAGVPRKRRQSRARRFVDPRVRERLQEWFRGYAMRGERPAFPPWLTEREFRERFETHGLRKFVLVLPTQGMMTHVRNDLLLRAILAVAALLACAALAGTWRGIRRSACLAVSLNKAREQNERLREMNAAAAGLAHETRNPLNVVRGLAQLIADETDDPDATRRRVDMTIEEVDRINSRLNAFIDYSRPREPQLEAVRLGPIVAGVAQALDADRDDKHIRLDVDLPEDPVTADPGLLRQVVFNLLLNAYQVLSENGHVTVRGGQGKEGFWLAVSDNGPGIRVQDRERVFTAYITLNEGGTGLGLAIVRQFVLQHQWEIECLESEEGGAEFRITGIRGAAEKPNRPDRGATSGTVETHADTPGG